MDVLFQALIYTTQRKIMLQLFEDFRLGIVRRNMVIKNVDSDDKWTFGLNLCEYLLYAIHPPYEIEPCPQYIYHFVLPVHQPSFFLSKENLEMYCKYLSNTCQIRLRAHLILFYPILVKHHQVLFGPSREKDQNEQMYSFV